MPDTVLTRAELTALMARVYALVQACPAGRVTTYGALAKAVGFPRGARLVGWIMNETPSRANIPAHRVLSATGELTGSWAFGQRGKMRALLEAEGVEFTPDDRVNMKQCAWDPMTALSDAERADIAARSSAIPVDISPRFLSLILNDKASPLRGMDYRDEAVGG